MRYMTSVIMVILLIIFTSIDIGAADKKASKTTKKTPIASKAINGKVSIDESILLDLVNMPLYHIEKAREYFLKKENEASANEIRISAIFVRLEAQRSASQTDQEALSATAKQLDDMGSSIEKGSISSIGEFDYNILTVGEVIADYHTTMAEAFSSSNEPIKAGYELKAAAEYAQHSYSWSDQKMEKETDEILSNSQILAGKMIGGTNVTSEEASKSIKGVNAEVKKLKEHTKRIKPMENKDKKEHRNKKRNSYVTKSLTSSS